MIYPLIHHNYIKRILKDESPQGYWEKSICKVFSFDTPFKDSTGRVG